MVLKNDKLKHELLLIKLELFYFFADIEKNVQVIENIMLSYGWSKALISQPKIVCGVKLRIMDFNCKDIHSNIIDLLN